MTSILLSVIIPVYNYHPNLNKCLDSIQNQTEKNIEIIIIDDCSADDIKSKIKNYFTDNRFIYRRLKDNQGPGGARNFGMSIAHGEYIGFCDSDDWVDLDFYKESCQLLIKNNAQIAICSQIREYESNVKSIYKCKYDTKLLINGNVAFQILSHNYKMGIEITPMCTNKVYRSSFLKQINAKFQQKVYFQDAIFSVKTIFEASKIVCVPYTCYHYYKRPNSIIQSFSQKHIDDFVNLGLSIMTYMKEKGIFDECRISYYNLILEYFNIIIDQIYKFELSESKQKIFFIEAINALKSLVKIEELFKYITAEQIYSYLIFCNNKSIFQ